MAIESVIRACACFVLAGPFLSGQTTLGERPLFEVASIRPSHDSKGASTGTSPSTLTIRNLPLRTIIGAAYGIAEYQIAGPEWLKRERFDILAKTGEPVASDDEMPLLQPLLADRFRTLSASRDEEPAGVRSDSSEGWTQDGSGRRHPENWRSLRASDPALFTLVSADRVFTSLGDFETVG
jgi:hypothetical protein